MERYDRLPVHRSASEVDTSVRAHIAARIPRTHRGPIVLVLGEHHSTTGAMAQSMAVLYEQRHERDKVYLTEAKPEQARDLDYAASRAAVKLLESLASHPRAAMAGPLDEAEFSRRVFGNDPPARGSLRWLIQDTCAKLTGYSLRCFDAEQDRYRDNTAREAAHVPEILANGSATGTTVVRMGDYHAEPTHAGLRECLPTAKVLCVAQALDPAPTNREAIHRVDRMLSDPDTLMLAGSPELEAARVDVTPFVHYALQHPRLIDRIYEDYETL